MHKKLLLDAGLVAVLMGLGVQTQANAQCTTGACGLNYGMSTYVAPVVAPTCGLGSDFYTTVSSPVVIGTPLTSSCGVPVSACPLNNVGYSSCGLPMPVYGGCLF